MITSNILFQQKNTTENDVAKRGIDIYFNQLSKTDDSIYKGIFPNYKDWRNTMNYYGSRLSAQIRAKLFSTDLDIIRGNEKRINYGNENTTTDFTFILNHYITKKPIIIGLVSQDENENEFTYRTAIYDSKQNDYLDSVSVSITANSREELIIRVANELNQELSNYNNTNENNN